MPSNKRRRQARHIEKRFRQEMNRNKLAEPGPNAFAIVIDKMKPNYNIGKIIRTADAFGARAIHLVDIVKFDPCTARGGMRYVPAVEHADFASAHAQLTAEGYTLFALDPETDVTLDGIELPERSAFVVGHEEFGFSFDPAAYPDVIRVKIQQYGHVQSLNASIAASLAMYEWLRQHRSPRNAAPEAISFTETTDSGPAADEMETPR